MQIRNQQISSVSLRFVDPELENEFREDYFRKTISHVRVALLVGIFLYGIFGILDRFIIPEETRWAWLIRFGIVMPGIALIYWWSFTSRFKKLMQPALVVTVFIAGAGIIGMLMIAAPPGNYLYYSGLILVIMYAYTFVKLRFIYATVACWIVLLAYETAALIFKPIELAFFVNNSFFLLSANLIGMVSCYQFERSFRLDFLQRKELRNIEQKRHLLEKEKLLKDLHDGVGGTTTTIAMLADMAQSESSLAEMKKTMLSISELACESITEIRSFLKSLDARELTWQALAGELRYRGANIFGPCGIAFSHHAEIAEGSGPPGSLASLNVFKIYQEALTNILKHAEAKSVKVTILVNHDSAGISIQDDGTGFSEKQTSGRGLENMRRRALEIGGTLAVANSGGTRVQLTIPLPQKYLDQGMENPVPDVIR